MMRTLSFYGALLGILAFLVLAINHYREKYLETTQALVTAQAINLNQAQAIAELRKADMLNRELTAKLLNQEQTLRKKAHNENQKLRKVLANDDCSHHRLPDAVIDILRQVPAVDANSLPAAAGSATNPL